MKFAVFRDVALRSGSSATAELLVCMTQDVVRASFSVQMEGASYPRGCVTETTTAETTRMNRTVAARVLSLIHI